jgi:MFS family permease
MPMVLVTMVALGLLSYLGYGEAQRTYTALVLERLAAQGETVQQSMSAFLLQDLPLQQFPGFSTVTRPLLDSDATIQAIYVTDANGRLIFSNTQAGASLAPQALSSFHRSPLSVENQDAQVSETSSAYRVGLPLRTRFEAAGRLYISIKKDSIQRTLLATFRLVLAGAVALFLLGCIVYALIIKFTSGSPDRRLTLAYSGVFALMTVVVMAGLTNLYAQGIGDKSRALATSLAERLDVPLQLGLNLSDFSGIGTILDQYRQSNPDIGFIGLTRGNTTIVQSGLLATSGIWQSPGDAFESDVRLSDSPHDSARSLVVRLGVPRAVVYSKLWESLKNFTALFLASMLLSRVILNLRYSLFARRSRDFAAGPAEAIGIIVPLYFFAVFSDSLNNSFLPQHFQAIASDAHVSNGVVSILFTVWYAAYALALFPSGLLAERFGVRPLFLLGPLLTTMNLTVLALTHQVPVLFATQFIDGLGQGMVFIGVQSYILRATSARTRTQGTGVIVFGFNGGLIAGNAIGSLLVVDPTFGEPGVFMLGSMLSLLVACYAFLVVPHRAPVQEEAVAAQDLHASVPPAATERSVVALLKDRIFSATAFLIGVPTKIVMAGLISATLPLLLAQEHYQTQDIGQLLMLYSCGVLLSSRFLSRLADRRGSTFGILLAGLLCSAIGLVLTGMIGWPQFAAGSLIPSVAVIVGLAILGLAHGCIQAPSLTHAASAPAARRFGAGPALSFYRLLERIGNISGPLVVGWFVVLAHGSAAAVSWLGLTFVVFLALFWYCSRTPARVRARPATT